MERDQDNITYTHTLETLYSDRGLKYQREKYLPKIEFMRNYFGDGFKETKVLDVGVGYGVFLYLLENEQGLGNLYGMDPFPGSIEIAKRYTSAEIVRGDITDDVWPVERLYFDVITCFDVVEHLEEPAVFFNRAKMYLKDGGILIVTTPNKDLPYSMRSIPLIGFPDRNPTHINVRRASYWKDLAAATGYEIIAAWKGEHLTHIRLIPKVFSAVCSVMGIDHRKIPLINSLEQSFCMVLRLSAS